MSLQLDVVSLVQKPVDIDLKVPEYQLRYQTEFLVDVAQGQAE